MNKIISYCQAACNEQIREITNARYFELMLVAIFVLVLIKSLLAVTSGWWNPITDFHYFRQTQTAISAYYLLHGGDWLAYETPVLGAPWSIPFEFPIYQLTVAGVARLLDSPLDQTGRFVSVLFYYLSLVCVYVIVANYKVSRINRLIFLSLILSSPLYLFWARAFLIESTALFFSLLYLVFVTRALTYKSKILFVAAAVTGVLAGLSKVTTFIGIGYLAAAIVAYHWYINDKEKPFKQAYKIYIIPVISFAAIPLVVAASWTQYTDFIKAKNPLTDFMLSSSLKTWNFGTFDQRLSGELWVDTVSNRIVPDLFGHKIWLIVIVALLVMAFIRKMPEAKYSFMLVAVFLLVLLTFTNLHIKHHLYTYANGIFLLCAMGFLLAGLMNSGKSGQIIGSVLFIVLIVSSIRFYNDTYYENYQNKDLKHAPVVNIANVVRTFTNPEDVILIYGFDWNSGIAYYSERRAIMDREFRPLKSQEIKAVLTNISPRSLGAVLLCRDIKKNWEIASEKLTELGFQNTPSYIGPLCDVYLPKEKSVVTHYLAKSDWSGKGEWVYNELKSNDPFMPSILYTLTSNTKNQENTSSLESAIFPLKELKVINIPIRVGANSNLEVLIKDSEGTLVLESLDISKLDSAWFNWQVSGEVLPDTGGAKIVIKDLGKMADEWIMIGVPKFAYVQ